MPLYHSVNWLLSIGFDIAYWQHINDVLSSLRMPLFFMLSGLFARKWLTAQWRDLLRVKTLLFGWVFLMWEVIGSAAITLGQIAQGQGVGLRSTVASLLISPIYPRFELWFIWALAVFFIVAKITRTVRPWFQLVIAGVGSAIALGLLLNSNNGWTGSAKYYFFFLVGLYLRKEVIRFSQLPSRLIAFGVPFLWILVSVALSVLGIRSIFPLYFLNCVLGVFAGICLSQLVMKSRILSYLGRNTLPIYLAHTPIIIAIVFLVSLLPTPHNLIILAVAPALLAVCAIASSIGLFRLMGSTTAAFLYEPPLWATRFLSSPRHRRARNTDRSVQP